MQKTFLQRREKTISKVGVFMPCYNMGDFLDEGLHSLYSQTFKDFSVIIADDASTNTETIKKLSTIQRPGCKIYFEKNNLGLIKISNKYISKLDAEYVVLLSPDDKLHPEFLRELVAYLDEYPDVHVVCSWTQEFGASKQLIKYDDDSCKLPEMLVSNRYSGAALMRKSAWLAAGKYDPNKNIYPNLDYDLWLSMLEKGFVLKTIPKPLFNWRVVNTSLSHSMGAEQMLVFRKALFKKYSNLYQQYSNYVIGQYLEIISNFENYYAVSTEGYEKLDQKCKNLIKRNAELYEELQLTQSSLKGSIQKPYLRSVLRKISGRLMRL